MIDTKRLLATGLGGSALPKAKAASRHGATD